MVKDKRRGGLFPKPLANAVTNPVANILNKRGFSHDAIMKYWVQAVGDDELAQYAFPMKMSQSANNSVLLVKVHPAYNAIFAHQADGILQRLNQLLGVRVARKIAVIN